MAVAVSHMIKESQCAESPSHLTKMEWKVSNCNCKFLDRGVSLYIQIIHTLVIHTIYPLQIHLLKYYIHSTGLPTNFTISNLVDVMKLQEQAEKVDNVKCGSCNEDRSRSLMLQLQGVPESRLCQVSQEVKDTSTSY